MQPFPHLYNLQTEYYLEHVFTYAYVPEGWEIQKKVWLSVKIVLQLVISKDAYSLYFYDQLVDSEACW